MKKNGFTLAEVLITLTIIGVIATMTLPALMTNTQEQQAKAALKKGINTLTEAAQLSQAIDGVDYASLTKTATNNGEILSNPSLYALLVNRTQTDMQKSGVSKLDSNSTTPANYTMFFRDGSALMFAPGAKSNDGAANKLEADGLPHGILAIFDTNGAKGPNVLSNCMKVTTGTTADAAPVDTDTTAKLNNACRSEQRVIKDQFAIRLRGGFAVPNSAAARWAFEN